MMKTFNTLDQDYYLFHGQLDRYIRKGIIDKNDPHYNKYIYLVKLKRFDNDDMYVYSYITYNAIFSKTILLYFLHRYQARNLIREELKECLILIDESISKKVFELDGIYLSDENALHNIHNIKVSEKIDSVLYLYTWLLYINYGCSMEDIANLVKLDLSRNYYDILSIIIRALDKINPDLDLSIKKDFNEKAETLFNPMDNCLIICSDLQQLLVELKKKNVSIDQGPKGVRGFISRMDSHLCTLDTDIRNTMFYHHRHHYYKQTFIKVFDLIPRHKFSFKNIHMGMGNVRWFSSRPVKYYRKTIKTTFSRQNLFLDNYRIIKALLQDKSFGLRDMQFKIEDFLQNQESKFSDTKNTGYTLFYTDKNFEFLNNKKQDLIKLLSSSDFSRIKGNSNKEFYLKWAGKFIEVLKMEFIADLLLSYFIEIMTRESVEQEDNVYTPGIPSITSFERFGAKLVNKYIYNDYINNRKDNMSLSLFKSLNKDKYKEFLDETFNSNIGAYFVQCLIEIDILYQSLDIKAGTHLEKEYYIRVPDNLRSNFLTNSEGILHTPQKLPMVCEPKDYVYSDNNSKNILGGYLLNDVHYTDYLFKDKVGYEIDTKLKEDNIVVDLINGLSKTPYKINKNVLEFIKLYGLEKGIILDDTEKKISNFMKNPYKYYTKKEKNDLRSLSSKISLQKNILNIAECYSDMEKLYFPVRLDNRTRIYCETDYFDYQKSDLAKGLILFVKPGIMLKSDIDIINYFKAYGANMFGEGLDKKSFNYRVKWVDSNSNDILNFRDNDIINKSENKACFLAFCFEYERFTEFMDNLESTSFSTCLPIQLDASCNGYQHLALLTRETSMFNKLNLGKLNKNQNPNDFYSYTLDQIYSHIRYKIKTLEGKQDKSVKESDYLESLKRLLKTALDRSIVKSIIMTNSYNASVLRLIEYLASNLNQKFVDVSVEGKTVKKRRYWYKDPESLITRSDISNFIMCMKEVLYMELPKIKELGNYLDSIAKICTKLNMDIPWNLPSGAMVRESYQKEKTYQLKAFSFLKAKYTFKKYIKGKFDLRKQKRSTMPNLIHSLDATTIALLYKDYKNIGCLYTIHDCFATTANHVPMLIDVLKSVYLKLYSSEDYLLQFDKLVRININSRFGNKVFELNDTEVRVPDDDSKKKTEILSYPDIDKVLNIKGHEKEKIKNLVHSPYIII